MVRHTYHFRMLFCQYFLLADNYSEETSGIAGHNEAMMTAMFAQE